MSNTRRMQIVYSAGVDSLLDCNSSFDHGVMKVCYTGLNRNNSFISKSTFENCMNTIYNCPVVCRYDRDTDTIGSHDVELVSDPDQGSIRVVNITEPVGVVPESALCWWENIEEDDGSVHEYLCTDVILWKRQEAYRKIKENGITEESMEITVKDGHMENGVYVINDFEFTAFCLLGTAEPCFESASVETFSLDEQTKFKADLAEMMQELKEVFALNPMNNISNGDSDKNYIHVAQKRDTKLNKGGDGTLNEKIELMKKFGLELEALNFKLEDYTLEELESKFEELTKTPEPATPNFALVEQFRSDLIEALHVEIFHSEYGDTNKYWYVDCDPEKSEVYCTDAEDWKLYGMTYSMNGDNIVIDFDSKKQKKFIIVDFDEGEQPSNGAYSMMGEFSKLIKSKMDADNADWENKCSKLEKDFDLANQTIKSMTEEMDSLKQYQSDVENAKIEKLFERFNDLNGNESFEALKENRADYSFDEIEEKCYAIRGRMVGDAKFSKVNSNKGAKLIVGGNDRDIKNMPYNGIFEKYGFKLDK